VRRLSRHNARPSVEFGGETKPAIVRPDEPVVRFDRTTVEARQRRCFVRHAPQRCRSALGYGFSEPAMAYAPFVLARKALACLTPLSQVSFPHDDNLSSTVAKRCWSRIRQLRRGTILSFDQIWSMSLTLKENLSQLSFHSARLSTARRHTCMRPMPSTP